MAKYPDFRKFIHLFVVAFCVLGWSGTAKADMVALDTGGSDLTVQVETDNYLPFDPCEGGLTSGGTWLLDLEYFHPDESDEIWVDLDWSLTDQYESYVDEGDPDDPNDDRTINWNYELAPLALGGILTIDWYQAVDDEAGSICFHGAEIVAYYDRADGEDALNLDWIQLYNEFGGSVFSPYEYTVDGNVPGDTDPAYYQPGDGPWIPDGYTLTGDYGDMVWTDGPYDSHLEANSWAGGVEFYIVLASYGDPYEMSDEWFRDITVYDGVYWGYVGVCVPEPATVVLLGLGLASIGIPRLRKRKP
ncbi:MAG: PEP-CTERM sorting domain-containing protein [Candidatus Hydrogenedentes bacterium]|nr:PEP-CTERM sorting domain-containing protein [Candidatus Hydrogenedentota bacterium]